MTSRAGATAVFSSHLPFDDRPDDALLRAHLARRLAQELAQADASTNAYVARAHRHAADLYRARLDGLVARRAADEPGDRPQAGRPVVSQARR